MASSLIGRPVSIGGKLTLNLLPTPELTATNVVIGPPDGGGPGGGPGGGTSGGGSAGNAVQADGLSLDLDAAALFHGRFRATSLTLTRPRIALPWPLPRGAASVTPPPFLAALNATIQDGSIALGAVTIEHVNATLHTELGAVSLTGDASYRGTGFALSGALDAPGPNGAAPLHVDATPPPGGAGPHIAVHAAGTLGADGGFTGAAAFGFDAGALGPGTKRLGTISGHGRIVAGQSAVAISGLSLAIGGGTATGSATLALAPAALSLTLAAHGADLAPLAALALMAPTHLDLTAEDARLSGIPIAHLRATADTAPPKATITALNASLPGNTRLTFTGHLADGALTGPAAIETRDVGALAAGLGVPLGPPPPGWKAATLTGTLSAGGGMIRLAALAGTIGPAHATGAVTLKRGAVPVVEAGLHLDMLDLSPLLPALLHPPDAPGMDADLELTADHATIGPVPIQRLLIDAAFGKRTVIHRVSGDVFGGLATLSGTIGADGTLTAAHATLSAPSGAAINDLLPPAYTLPAALADVPLALGLDASGPPGALKATGTLSLGALQASAEGTLDLPRLQGGGALLVRHPDAIALLGAFGIKGNRDWPGPGSASLRASLTVSPQSVALPDAVFAFGATSGSGRIALTPQAGTLGIAGQIAADTLDLPLPDAAQPLPWAPLAALSGTLGITAGQVLAGGAPLLANARATLTLAPDKAALALASATLGQGDLAGSVTAGPLTGDAPPTLSGTLTLTNADAGALAVPLAFPLGLATGTVDATATLSATGYAPRSWLQTLAGTASLGAKAGTLTGLSLAASRAAGAGKGPGTGTGPGTSPGTSPGTGTGAAKDAAAAKPHAGGPASTAFDRLDIAGTIADGMLTIPAPTGATLSGAAGTVDANGTLDLADRTMDLHLLLTPAAPKSPAPAAQSPTAVAPTAVAPAAVAPAAAAPAAAAPAAAAPSQAPSTASSAAPSTASSKAPSTAAASPTATPTPTATAVPAQPALPPPPPLPAPPPSSLSLSGPWHAPKRVSTPQPRS